MRRILPFLASSVMLGVLAPDATGAQIPDPTPDVQFVFDPSSGTPSPEVLEALTAERAASIGRALMILGDAAPRETTVSFHAYSSAVLKGMATRGRALGTPGSGGRDPARSRGRRFQG